MTIAITGGNGEFGRAVVQRLTGLTSEPVIATVPSPSSARKSFPYQAFRPYADVFAPMVYWSCLEPGAVTQQSVARLRGILPVAPVGQAYDMGGEGGRRGTPSHAETLRFLDASRRAGALGANDDEALRERLRGEVERLAGPDGMGDLFKVLEIPALRPRIKR